MNRKLLMGLVAGAIAAPATASQVRVPEDFQSRVYVTPSISYTITDDYLDTDINDTLSGGAITLGKEISPRWNIETSLNYNRFETDTQDSAIFQPSLTVDALYNFRDKSPAVRALRSERFEPFLLAGLGVAYNDFNGPDEDQHFGPLAQAGIGTMFRLNTYGAALRADVRYRIQQYENPFNGDKETAGDVIFNLGVQLPSRYKVAAAAPVAPAPTPVNTDIDNDGVANSIDRCPNTPRGTLVNAQGCPAPTDNDNDGVANAMDKCPRTPAGTKVNAEGCPLPETVVIYFAFDSSVLTPEAKAALNRVATHIGKHEQVIAIASGHADDTGTEEYNAGLSKRRAQAVAAQLQANGIASNRIRQRAYGETRPVADNATEAGRARNRRVEIDLVHSK